MPLDLKDEYLFMDEDTLSARAQDTLDSQGWNNEGGVYSSTYLRVDVTFARLREQIIEMALGHASTASTADVLYALHSTLCSSAWATLTAAYSRLKTLIKDTVAGLPPILSYTSGDILDPSLRPQEVQIRYFVRLDTLQNEFCVDRILLSKGHVDDGSLLATSFELLSLFTSVWINIDRFSMLKPNLGWMVRCYFFR
jgi:hypothetical protein